MIDAVGKSNGVDDARTPEEELITDQPKGSPDSTP